MNLNDELEKLAALHQNGLLTNDEFAMAKAKLLTADQNKDSLGRAANRGITLIWISSVVSVVLILAFFFGFFLPAWNGHQAIFEQHSKEFVQTSPSTFSGSGQRLDDKQ